MGGVIYHETTCRHRNSWYWMNFSKRTPAIARTDEDRSSEAESNFDGIFQQFWKPVCVVIYRIVGDWAEAEDIALEVFIQLHRHPPKAGGQLSGWLYRVGTNLGLNALRSRKRREHYEAQAVLQEALERTADDPAFEVQRKQEREHVQSVLVKMKARSAQLLTLRQAGLSYAEIAQALSVAPGSVGTLLARAEAEFERRYRQERDE
jgi:RNA polymerase sigma-70 factor, ECF subfamily